MRQTESLSRRRLLGKTDGLAAASIVLSHVLGGPGRMGLARPG